MTDYPFFREVSSPLTTSQLKSLDPRCERVQINSHLTEKEFRKLAGFLREYPNVGLRVYGNYEKNIADLDFLKHFSFIKKFTVEVWELENFDGLEVLQTDLEELGIGQTRSKRHSLRFLERFPNLKTLYLESHTKDFATVGQLQHLEDLTLRSITLPNLSVLTALSHLKSLDIKLGGTTDLRLLPKVGKLRYLELWLIRGLTDITPVAKVESLQYLFLQALRGVNKLPSFHRLTALRRLHIETMKGLTDLRPICTAPALEELIVTDMPHLQPKAFRPLMGQPTLKAASIGLGSLNKNKAVHDMLNLPQVKGDKWGFTFV